MGTMSFMSMHIFPLLRNKQLLPPQLKCVNNFRLHCSLNSISTRRISYRFKEVHYGKEDDLKHISDYFKNVARASFMTFMCNRKKRVSKNLELKQDAKIKYSKQNLSVFKYIQINNFNQNSAYIREINTRLVNANDM